MTTVQVSAFHAARAARRARYALPTMLDTVTLRQMAGLLDMAYGDLATIPPAGLMRRPVIHSVRDRTYAGLRRLLYWAHYYAMATARAEYATADDMTLAAAACRRIAQAWELSNTVPTW